MATGTPHLDNFTGSIDALPYSLDSALLLTKVDWSNPDLEQLDNWGTLEQLDAYGLTLDQLDQLEVKHFEGTATAAITVAAEVQFAIEMPAAVSISASATSGVNRVRPMAGSVTGVASFEAVITPIRTMDASVSVAVTDAAELTRLRTSPAPAAISATTTASSSLVYLLSGTANAAVTTTSASNGIFVMAGEADAAVSVACNAKILGEEWGEVATGSEVWGDVAVGSEIWGTVTVPANGDLIWGAL